MRKIRLVTIATLALTLAAANARPLDPHTIVVSGSAEIVASPDHATINIGVVTSDLVVAKALQANSVEMERVVAAIKALGIPETAMQTSEFSIKPLHPKTQNGYDEDEAKTLGYQVSNKLSISVTDLSKVADIIDASVEAGANSSNSISFEVKDRAAYGDKALAAAINNARHRAEVMANAEHLKVGRVISLTTEGANFQAGVGDLETVVVTGVRAPVLPGQITISANVMVTYAIE